MLIDAFSKYGGFERVKSATGFSTVRKLNEVFLFFGNPEQIVSDNGTPFNSQEFGEFCKVNSIRHIRSAPYHPSTKGEAERFVQVFKRALRPQFGNKVDVQAEIIKFLQRYRTTPHSTRGRSPSELIFGCTIRTTLNLLKPQVETQVLKQQSRSIQNHDRTARDREFAVGQPVFTRQYLGPRKWVGSVISRRIGPLLYDVQIRDQIISKHSSQLLSNRAHHQDLSDQQLDQLYDDGSVQPEPEQNMQPKPERNIDA